MENLGKSGRDKVTGFEGVITGLCFYLYGCSQYCLMPKTTDGKLPEGHWFDSGRIEIVGDGIKPSEVKGEKDGGPQDCCPVAR